MTKTSPVGSRPTSGKVPPDTAPTAADLGKLSGQQRTLYDALLEKDLALKEQNSIMARMYLGAILVLQQADNPDRLALSAHGLRELMEKMSRYLAVPVPQGGGESARIRGLCDQWKTAEKQKDNPVKFDKARNAFFEGFGELVASQDGRPSGRKEAAGYLLDRLDPSKVPLPKPIKDIHVSAWDIYHKFFQAVSHHNQIPTADEFNGYLMSFEQFLLDRLRPRTFDDQKEIKAIIEEGERNAKP